MLIPQQSFIAGTANRYISSVYNLQGIPPAERLALAEIAARYPFYANSYYLSLIDWNDRHDPLRRLIIPSVGELQNWGNLDPSNEASITVAPGVQHKYPHTVLLLCSETCGGYCRYCFRKRLFMPHEKTAFNLPDAIRYIAEHPAVTNVLLTGGDPLTLRTTRLVEIISALRKIPHLKIIRIGSKMPAFNPQRILNDPQLWEAFRLYSEPRRRLYLMTHFDHPRELTDDAVAALDICLTHGVICANQCPLIKGINDDPGVLSDLFRQLSFVGCPPYYVFQCRPTAGNKSFAVPIVRGWKIFQEAMGRGSGLARRPRFVMSHARGKIEIVGVTNHQILMRFHRARDHNDSGRVIRFHRNDEACWLDELQPVEQPAYLG